MLWILLVVLTVVGGVTAVGVAMRNQTKGLGGGPQKALPEGSGDALVERSVRDLRVDDVLALDGKDYLCEGVIAYDEDGHRWICGRIVDGKDVAWLLIGIDRTASMARLLVADDSVPMEGYPPEVIVVGELRYVLDKRGAATCQLFGDVGGLGTVKTRRPDGHVERCRWWLYSAPGDDTLLVEQWGSDYRVLRGRRMADGTIELIPAS